MEILLPGTNPGEPHAAPVHYTSWLTKESNPQTSPPATSDRSCTHVFHSVPSRSDTNLVCSFGALTNTVTGTPTRDPVCPFSVLQITTTDHVCLLSVSLSAGTPIELYPLPDDPQIL